MPDASCVKCLKPIKTNAYKIQCVKCNHWYHRDCANLSIEQIQEFNKEKTVENGKRWLCTTCYNPALTPNLNVITPTENESKSPAKSTTEALKVENHYLKLIIQELRDNNTLLKQNKNLLEEKISSLEKKLEGTKNHVSNEVNKEHSNIKRKPNLTIASSASCHQIHSAPLPNESSGTKLTFDFQPEHQITAPGTQNNATIKTTNLKNTSTVAPTSWAQVAAGRPPVAPQVNKNNTSRPKRNIFIGTGETNENESFFGRNDKNKKVWLFISRVPDSIDETTVRNYVKNKTKITDEEDLIVKHIPTRIQQIKADSKCFQVGIRYNLLDTVYHQNFWPRNIAFERYKFRRNLSPENKITQETENDFLGV